MKWFTKLQKSIVHLYKKFSTSKKSLILWDILYVGFIGVNSYILLIYNNSNEPKMMRVICAMTVAYVTSLITILIKLREDKKLRKILYLTNKIFRLIYTATYLTIIVLHLIRLGSFKTISSFQSGAVIYNIIMFFFIAIIGTSSLWWKKALNAIIKRI